MKRWFPIFIITNFFILIFNYFNISFPINNLIPKFAFYIFIFYLLIQDLLTLKNKKEIENKKGKYTQLILILIILISTFFRSRYWNNSFTTDHPMKYAAYVEPAKFMAEKQNIFHYEKKYYLNKVDSLDKKIVSLNHLPVLEWVLAFSYFLSPFNLELTTRIALHLIFIINIILIFKYLREKINDKVALLTIFFLSINPIFNFIHYVTVIDSILITFTFIFVMFLEKFYKTKKDQYLKISGIILGLASITKSSVFLWVFPLFLSQELMRNKKNKIETSILNSYKLLFFTFIQFIYLYFVVYQYPYNNLLVNVIKTSIWIFINYLLIKFKNQTNIKINKKLIYFSVPLLMSVSFFIFRYSQDKIFSYLGDFITNKNIIFYWPMYEKIFNNLRSYLTNDLILVIFIIQILLSLINYSKTKEKGLIIALLMSIFAYILMASKVIYIHNYYNAIILLFIFIVTSIFLVNIRSSSLLFLIFILFFSNKSIQDTNNLLSFQRNNYFQIQDFVKNETNNENKAIYSINKYSYYAPIIDSGVINGNQILNDNYFVEKIKENGLEETLIEENIVYFVQEKNELDSQSFFNRIYISEKVLKEVNRDELVTNDNSDQLINNQSYIKNDKLINVNYNFLLETEDFKIYKLEN